MTSTVNYRTEPLNKNMSHQDLTAKSDLILIISSGQLRNIKSCTTSKHAWDTLNNIYASKGPARKATLLKKLILHKAEDSGDVRNHLDQFIYAFDKLLALDIVINDDLLLSITMFYSLSPLFENFRVATESGDTLPKPDQLGSKSQKNLKLDRKWLILTLKMLFSLKALKTSTITHKSILKLNQTWSFVKKWGQNNHPNEKC